MWIYDQHFPCLHPSYQSQWMWFLSFRSCQISIQLNFWWFWVIVALYLSCNFDVLVGRDESCLPMLPSWPEIWKFFKCFLVSPGIRLCFSLLTYKHGQFICKSTKLFCISGMILFCFGILFFKICCAFISLFYFILPMFYSGLHQDTYMFKFGIDL